MALLSTLLAANLLALTAVPPLGLPPLPVPADNPISEEKIALGRKLFFDRRLSFNGTLSCAMCHIPEQGFTQHEVKTPVGIEGSFVKRNSPALYNVGYRTTLFHDGREDTLENQVWQPLLRENEMANPSIGFVLSTIRGAADYDGLFEAVFERGVAMEGVGKALASYQRSLLSADSPFDRWYFAGDKQAMSESAVRGFALFKSKACVSCHIIGTQYALFSDGEFHDTGIGYFKAMIADKGEVGNIRLAPGVEVRPTIQFQVPSVSDLGRYEATGRANDRWLYSTPALRNVAITAPYMHDGSLPNLQAVVEFYNRGAIPHAELDSRLKPLGLKREQIEDLVNFLRALTGSNIEQLQRDARSTNIGNP
ncbi:MAG: cytochrome C peroxidase [Proteobacteria bacterium]|nr:cytochrome C peroxidase [Pseudomonadota bacterium]